MRLRQEKEREKKQEEDRQRTIGKQQEKELHRMGKQQKKEQEKEQLEEHRRRRREQENALAQLNKIQEEKKPAVAEVQKYRQIVIDRSEEDGLLEEILTSARIESLHTQHCPNCHVRIEKNGGCSHMHCSRCDHHFTWESIQKSEVFNTNSLLNYSSNNPIPIESIKEELNNHGDIGLQEIIHFGNILRFFFS